MTPVGSLDAEKIAEAVFILVFRIAFTASFLPFSAASAGPACTETAEECFLLQQSLDILETETGQ